MKKYLAQNLRFVAVMMVAALGLIAFVAPQVVEAQSAPEKIRLMAETLRARDSGNLSLAKEKAEELIKVAPDDANVQRLLASINRDLERQSGVISPTSDAPVFGKAGSTSVDDVMEAGVGTTGMSEAEIAVEAEAAKQQANIDAAADAIKQSQALAELGAYDEASVLLASARANIALNTATAEIIGDLDYAQADLIYEEALFLAENGKEDQAEALLQDYISQGGKSTKARALSDSIDSKKRNPYQFTVNEVSPDYVAQSAIVRDLLTKGRAQFLNGDYDGAAATFKEVEARDANNAEAKLFNTRIAQILGDIHNQNLYKTRAQMLTEVDQGWERPKVFEVDREVVIADSEGGNLQRRMETIILPQVNFSGMEMTRVIETLFELSREYDPQGIGVNIVPLFDPNETNPRVNISLRNLNLDRILDFVTQQVKFDYSVGEDAVTVSQSDAIGSRTDTITEFFPISRATVIRLTGFRDNTGGGGAGPIDPFAPAPAVTGGGTSQSDEVQALQNFFQSAGVNFELAGTSLAFDGEQLIVTQTSRNLERMRTILRNYNEVKQVEIEAKFLEVTQNDLDEFGFSWAVQDGGKPLLDEFGAPIPDQFGDFTTGGGRNFTTGNRTINSTFGIGVDQSAITINGQTAALNAPPSFSDAIDLAAGAGNAFTSNGWSIAGASVDMAIRALSRKTGSDLMSAPKVTVLSGKRANITVAQELRYPESYGDIESTVSSSNAGGNAISITAGTPQDFVTRNIGVEMSVTPNVENDDTISLILEPRVTEFEGFVEYGGPSVAVVGGGVPNILGQTSSGTTVTVPPGFYQPVFSTREITTEVTIFDGATVVMGGLTRDQIQTVNDSVPILGNIPGIGRLFRSEGETRQKRNLLIFVTANLVSPGGSPSRQQYRNVMPNSLFQNPTIMTPAGQVNRSIPATAE